MHASLQITCPKVAVILKKVYNSLPKITKESKEYNIWLSLFIDLATLKKKKKNKEKKNWNSLLHKIISRERQMAVLIFSNENNRKEKEEQELS